MNSRQLDDLLALLDAKSLTEAAQNRNVTQPAFSRRVKAIENALGFQVIDRTKKPGKLNPSITARQEEIRAVALSLNRLVNDIKSESGPDKLLRIAAMHSISVSALPLAIKSIEHEIPSTKVQLRSGNLKECYAMLVTGEVEILVSYETEQRRLRIDDDHVERILVKSDRFIPVVSSNREKEFQSWTTQEIDLPVVMYPEGSFMGGTLTDLLLEHNIRYSVRAISSLSPAILQMALTGIGVGWITKSQAAHFLANRQLSPLMGVLPNAKMQMVMMRLRSSRSKFLESGWEALKLALSD